MLYIVTFERLFVCILGFIFVIFFPHPWPLKVKVPHPADISSIDNIPSHINFTYFLIILVSP